jgi:hypothetical protein
MRNASSDGLSRVLAKCPKCGSLGPKKLVGAGRSEKLYCASCGRDFVQKKGMSVSSFYFALLAMLFAIVVLKLRHQTLIQEYFRPDKKESASGEQVVLNPAADPRWTASDPQARETAARGRPRRRGEPEKDFMDSSEKEIRKQWGWDTKGSSLNQPVR